LFVLFGQTAGNVVEIIDNLSGLRSLTELNLRRNKIEKVLDLDTLPNLQVSESRVVAKSV
jgi:Leucine-rich repeat (LRR) protein